MGADPLSLARQLAALPGFTVSTPADFALYHQQGATYFRDARGLRWVDVAGEDAGAYEWLPDLTDDATVGALAGAVREAYGDPTAYCLPDGLMWVVWAHLPVDGTPAKYGVGAGPTEFAAWLAAWNARPR